MLILWLDIESNVGPPVRCLETLVRIHALGVYKSMVPLPLYPSFGDHTPFSQHGVATWAI